MENSSLIVDWVLQNSRGLGLTVQKVTWIDEWLPGYFDYHVEVSVGGHIHKGRGTDSSEQLAFVKAAAEALERAACYSLDNPWGTAAHSDPKEAERRAYAELLGMDRALCHHYCKTKGAPVALEELKSVLPVNTLVKQLARHGLTMSLCELRPAKDARVFSAYGWALKEFPGFPGVISGFGTSDIWQDAARQAVLECLRKFLALFIGGVAKPAPLEVLKQQKSPWWHIWTMAESAASKSYLLKNLLADSGIHEAQRPEDISIDCASFSRIDSLDKVLPGLPLLFMQARSPRLLHPQFGETIIDPETKKRLIAFNAGLINVDLSVPHFYG